MAHFFTLDTEYMPGKENIDATFEYGLCEVKDGTLTQVLACRVDPNCGQWGPNHFGYSSDDLIGEKNWHTAVEFFDTNVPSGSTLFHHAGEDGSRITRLFERADREPHFEVINTLPLTREHLGDLAAPTGRQRKTKHTIERFSERLELKFEHHVASEDAKVLVAIILKMIERVGFEKLKESRPTENHWSEAYRLEKLALREIAVNEGGEYFGKTVLFTDCPMELQKTLVGTATEKGLALGKSLSKKVDILVVGDLGKSKKPIKANEMNLSGKANIDVMSVEQFRSLLEP